MRRPRLLGLLLAAACGLGAQEEAGDFLEEGRLLLEMRRFEPALAAFAKAIQAAPGSAEARAGWGEAAYGLGRIREARKALQQSLALDPEQPRLKELLERHLGPRAEDAPPPGKGDWLQPLWRSALLPGWGQVYNGQAKKGVSLGALTLSLLGGAAATYLAADAGYQDYLRLGPGTSEAEFGESFSRVEGYALANHVLVVLFYSAYVYNLGDAAANARARPLKLGATPRGGLGLAADFRF